MELSEIDRKDFIKQLRELNSALSIHAIDDLVDDGTVDNMTDAFAYTVGYARGEIEILLKKFEALESN